MGLDLIFAIPGQTEKTLESDFRRAGNYWIDFRKQQKIAVGHLAGRNLGLFEFLPSAHPVSALHKILTFGIMPGDLLYEIGAMAALSLIFYGWGSGPFGRLKMRESVSSQWYRGPVF